MRLKIAPSILSADFSRLGEQVRAVEEAGADQIHVDVMDGHFVPNLSMGPLVVAALRRVTSLPLDVHLMITDPDKYLEAFVDAGASHITVHVEASGDLGEMFDGLEKRGVGRGIALNPETPVESVIDFMPRVDMVLVMTVHPGFGGQSFLAENLNKMRRLREEEALLTRPAGEEIDIEVDGGIDAATIVECQAAGANVFVAGSSIFGSETPGRELKRLRESLRVSVHPDSE